MLSSISISHEADVFFFQRSCGDWEGCQWKKSGGWKDCVISNMWAHPVKCTACTNCFRRLPEWQYSQAPLGSLRFYRQSLRCFFSLKGGSWPQQCVLGAWAIPHTAILKALFWSSGASGFLCSLQATCKATRWQPCTETLLGCVTKTLVLLRRCLIDVDSKKTWVFVNFCSDKN